MPEKKRLEAIKKLPDELRQPAFLLRDFPERNSDLSANLRIVFH
jgi:hypothetical protein